MFLNELWMAVTQMTIFKEKTLRKDARKQIRFKSTKIKRGRKKSVISVLQQILHNVDFEMSTGWPQQGVPEKNNYEKDRSKKMSTFKIQVTTFCEVVG